MVNSIPPVQVSETNVEHPFNQHLFSIILVVYGAVLSLAMYVIASYIATFSHHVHEAKTLLDILDFFKLLVLYVLFLLWVVEDLASIIKYDKAFPFKRASRYGHEIVISFFYLASFALLDARSSVGLVAFGLALVWNGIWLNQLKEEYKQEFSELRGYARLSRNFHYVGGALLALAAGVALALDNSNSISWALFGAYCALYILWYCALHFVMVHKHGHHAMIFMTSIYIPDSFLLRGEDGNFLNPSSRDARGEGVEIGHH